MFMLRIRFDTFCTVPVSASTPDSAFQTCIDQFEIKDGNRLRNTPRACAVAAFVRPRFRTVQVGRHLAIVDPLLVARLAAKPLLRGLGRLDVPSFALSGLSCCMGLRTRHERPRR